MTPKNILFGIIALLGTSSVAYAQDRCPPDPTYNCTPNYVRPGDGGRPGPYPGPGRPVEPPRRPWPEPYPPSRPYPDYPYRPIPAPAPSPIYSDRREITVYRDMINERLMLNSYVGDGYLLDSVEVYSQYNSYGAATVNLLVDSFSRDSDYNPASYAVLYPHDVVSLDSYSRPVQIEVLGRLYVERIVINIHRRW